MSKLIITDKGMVVAPNNMSLSVNGKQSQEIPLEGLDDSEVSKLKKNPKDKNVLAKIDRIKRGEKDGIK